jgi:uncharacterized protein YfaP (DUF2135 family)
LSVRVPQIATAGDITLSIKYVGRASIPPGGDPTKVFVRTTKVATGTFTYFAPLPVVVKAQWCNECNAGRMCIVTGRCGDRSTPIEDRAPISSTQSGRLTLIVKNIPSLPVNSDGSIDDLSLISLALGSRFATFERVAYIEARCNGQIAFEFSVPAVPSATRVQAMLKIRSPDFVIPSIVIFSFAHIDSSLRVVSITKCDSSVSGGSTHFISMNLPISQASSLSDQISVRFGTIEAENVQVVEPEDMPADIVDASTLNADGFTTLQVTAPPFDCSTCRTSKGKAAVALTVISKVDPEKSALTVCNYWSAPTIISAQFDNSGTVIKVKWDQLTNRGEMTSSDADCGLILHQDTLSQLGDAPECMWSADDVLDIYLGVGATAVPGIDPGIQAANDKIKSSNLYSAYSHSKAPILAPATLQRPVFTLKGANTIDSCSELRVSATYSSPRPLVFSWGCLNDDGLARAIKSQTGNGLKLAPGTREMAEADKAYQISARATNFFGAESELMIFTVFKKSSPVPLLIFEPASMNVYKGEDVLVSVVAQFSLCPMPASRMIFTWRQVSGPKISEQYLQSGSQFWVPGDSLIAGSTYILAVQVVFEENSAITAENQYMITVLERPLIARIRGGNRLLSSALLDLMLDASSSQDPDAEVESQNLGFAWSCSIGDGPCFDYFGSEIELSGSSNILVPSGTLKATFDVPYTFKVRVSKQGKIPAETAIEVYLDEEKIPLVYVSSYTGVIQDDGAFKINAQDALMLEGICNSDDEPDMLSWDFTPNIEVSAETFSLSDWYGQMLWLPSAEEFTPGNRYTASFSCTVAGSTGHSQIVIEINTVPKGPPCTICLFGAAPGECIKEGPPVSGIFDYSCTDWADADSPLEYQFGYFGTFNGEYQEVTSGWSGVSAVELSFPSGVITVKSRVRDALGASSVWMLDVINVFEPIILSFSVYDPLGLQGNGKCCEAQEITGANFTVYHNIGARTADACAIDNQCGDALFSGSVLDERLVFNEKGLYLIRVAAPGYYPVAFKVMADKAPVFLDVYMIKTMSQNQNRVKLSWKDRSDLDLWVFARFHVVGDYSGFAPAIGWWDETRTATYRGSTIALDVDNQNGRHGPETTRFENLGTGKFEVWVNMFEAEDGSEIFTQSAVRRHPASVDVFCHRCKRDGGSVAEGLVTTIVQQPDDVPLGASWWKVGTFIKTSSALEWNTCTSDCYFGDVSVPLWVDAFYVMQGWDSRALGATYKIFSDFSTETMYNCEDLDKCGTLVATGSVVNPTDDFSHRIPLVPANNDYLVIVNHPGYIRMYLTVPVSLLGETSGLYVGMVESLQENQDRVVLNWNSNDDLDLVTAAFPSATPAVRVSWESDDNSETFGATTITLDVNNHEGRQGPEVMQYRSLIDGVYEVWVNFFSAGSFNSQFVANYTASVDIYCYSCIDEYDQIRAGFVTSVSQRPEDVSGAESKWWKVGEFVASANGARLKWMTCRSECYWHSLSARMTVRAIDLMSRTYLVESGATFQMYGVICPGGQNDYSCRDIQQYLGCENRPPPEGALSACGTPVVEGDVGIMVRVPSNALYLGVVEMPGYYKGYFVIWIDLAASNYANMVSTLGSGENRAVLRWDSDQDLDMLVDVKFKTGVQAIVNYQNPSASAEGTSVDLEIENTNGFDGPETMVFKNLAAGTFEMWIHVYSDLEMFTPDSVKNHPATVEVFCSLCLDSRNQPGQGMIESITQNFTKVPERALWWKVGQWISPPPPSAMSQY